MAVSKSAPPRPVIGIAADLLTPKAGVPYVRANVGYVDAVLAAGGLPLVLPPVRKDNFPELDAYLDLVAGVVLVGGLDLDPRRLGQQPGAASQPMAARREESDRLLLTKVIERRLPVLGIGVGMQLINVHFGGTLYPHLPVDAPKAMPHFDPSGGPHRHMVSVEPNTTLQDMYGADELRVNSQHHQGVNQVGKRLRVAARAPDGVIEAVETTDDTWFCVGVQWHPEADTASALDRQIFDCLVQAAAKHEPAGVLAGV
jgi:putative glutamine amidotransferase